MSTWAEVGVKCRCIVSFWEDKDFGPRSGQELTISKVYLNPHDLVSLLFVECDGWEDPNTGNINGFNIRNFIPIIHVLLLEHEAYRDNMKLDKEEGMENA